MSRSFDCYSKDEGRCFVPDEALVLIEGHVRVAASEAAEAFLDQRDLLSEASVQLVPRLEPDEHEALLTGRSLRSPSRPDSGVIATCTCGHVYVVR